jgi:hypothetical protein
LFSLLIFLPFFLSSLGLPSYSAICPESVQQRFGTFVKPVRKVILARIVDRSLAQIRKVQFSVYPPIDPG